MNKPESFFLERVLYKEMIPIISKYNDLHIIIITI